MAIKKGDIIKNSEREQREAYMFTSAELGDKGGVSFGDSVAVTLNGIQIYRPWDVTESAIPHPGNETIQEYLLHNLKKELVMLPDGTYQLHIDNILIDTIGKVVSYHYLGIRGGDSAVSDYMQQIIANRVDYLLGTMPAMVPANAYGTSVPILMDILVYGYEIEIKNYIASYKKVWDSKHIYSY